MLNLLAMLAAMSVAARAESLIGGEPLSAEHPIARTTVALAYHGHAFCSGTLVANDLVVTAAHCVRNSRDIEVLFEADTSVKNPRRRPIVGYEMAPGYDPKDQHRDDETPPPRDRSDIALARFSGGVPEGYHAARLLPPGYSFDDGEEVLLAGYGHSARPDREDDPIGVLRAGVARIRDAHFATTEIQIDARPGSGAENAGGDSGGPALTIINDKLYVFGVCNWGKPSEFSVFALISPRLDWLASAAERLRH